MPNCIGIHSLYSKFVLCQLEVDGPSFPCLGGTINPIKVLGKLRVVFYRNVLCRPFAFVDNIASFSYPKRECEVGKRERCEENVDELHGGNGWVYVISVGAAAGVRWKASQLASSLL